MGGGSVRPDTNCPAVGRLGLIGFRGGAQRIAECNKVFGVLGVKLEGLFQGGTRVIKSARSIEDGTEFEMSFGVFRLGIRLVRRGNEIGLRIAGGPVVAIMMDGNTRSLNGSSHPVDRWFDKLVNGAFKSDGRQVSEKADLFGRNPARERA